MPRPDPHSYADSTQPVADMLVWRAHIDFSARALACEATLRFQAPAAGGELDLDTRDLSIESVTDQDGRQLRFEFGEPDAILGKRLRISLADGATAVRIRYVTAPDALALQWLEPAQTQGGRQPFLYTQCQPIHARSIVPVQDTPMTRLQYEAELDVPNGFTVLMAAEAVGHEERGDRTVARFRMRQPISPYLFAFAVGDLVSRELGPRSRVWAEADVIEAATWEFADTDRMLTTGEQLFGEYDWERYDLLVLPPAFPYGGMENPRLTFVTPTMLAGDRSLTGLIAHELAHSWTGNLVSNANAEHFWLNEGGATYAERRIVEALWGPDMAALEWALGRRGLDDAIARLDESERPPLTRLRTELQGIDPDDAYTLVPYEKGALLLRSLEDAVGRSAFDAFIHEYIREFRFGVLTSEQFLAFLEARLPADRLARTDVRRWLYEPGVPDSVPRPRSSRLDAINALQGQPPSDDQAREWSAIEWQLYIESMPNPSSEVMLAELDRRFALTSSRNYDVLVKWLVLAIRSNYRAPFARLEEVLATVGRMMYLRALYRALAESDTTYAQELFERNAKRYHPIARHVLTSLLKSQAAAHN